MKPRKKGTQNQIPRRKFVNQLIRTHTTSATEKFGLTVEEAEILVKSFNLKQPNARERLNQILSTGTREQVLGIINARRAQLQTPHATVERKETPTKTGQIVQQPLLKEVFASHQNKIANLTSEQKLVLTKMFRGRKNALVQLLRTQSEQEIVRIIQEVASGRRNPQTLARNLARRNPRTGRRRIDPKRLGRRE